MEATPYRAALVGDSQSVEMSPVRSIIGRKIPHWEVRDFRRLHQLLEAGPSDGYFPDLVLICQRWRDEYSADQVREGLAVFPVARWICVYGAWCESEGRHGSRWPIAVRVPLRALETRLGIEAAVVKGHVPALPLTAARDEVFEFDTQLRFPTPIGLEDSVAVISPDPELRAWLSDLCKQAGFRVLDANGKDAAHLLIVDLDPFTESLRASLRTLNQRHPRANILALMGMVRPEDLHQLREEEGLAAVLSKLTPAAQLLETIRRLAHGKQGEKMLLST